ncbi:serine/threonine-protein kinase [Aquabacterium sp.]|uniref:serine/threonine-protein kinase n=1 Tax=Aquabacterium sp. TaxID=1872578 RepID=UPI003784661B
MDRTRWQQLSALLDEALALRAAERAQWLAGWRARDAAIAEQLERMLAQAGPDDEAEGDGAAPPAAAVDIDLDRTRPVLGADFEKWLGQALSAGGTAAWPAPGADTITLALQRCGSWQLLHKIGEGGMGQVWLARRADGLYEAQAAIKLLRGDVRATRLAARFARERALLARLNHPAIARLLDAGVDEGRAFLVLEYVEGRALAEHVRTNCPTVADRVRLMIRIAEGVEHAHAQLIVHRDLKPSNVLVTAAGEPKLLDFGIAGVLDAEGQAGDEQLTRQLGRMMTPAYAAPEQVKGEPIGIGADIFSLCVMLFELLSGELPFAPRDTDRAALEHALLHKPARRLTQTRPSRRSSRFGTGTRSGSGTGTAGTAPAPAPALPGTPAAVAQAEAFAPPEDFDKVRGDLEAIVAKGLRKQPEERYGSVRALITDLERWLSHRPVSVRRDDWQHRAGLWLRRNALVSALTGGVTLALLAGLAVSTWQWRRAEAAARQSELVTQYLGELLASANPDRHRGEWPTVLQLLETSRGEIEQRFRNDPETLERLQGVLSETYTNLNRFDIALPIAERRLALAERAHGADDARTLRARIDLANRPQAGRLRQGDRAAEPMRGAVARAFGERSGEHASLLTLLAYAYARTGRLDEAERTLDAAGRLLEALYPPGSVERVLHWNELSVLRSQQGRYREALAALKQTLPYWNELPHSSAGSLMALRRNMIALQIRLCDYEQIEARAAQLVQDLDKLYGPASDIASGVRAEMARYHTEIGQYKEALAWREANVSAARAAGVKPLALLPLRALRLPAQALAQAAPQPQLRDEARQLLAEIDAAGGALGYRRGESWLALARLGLLIDDTDFAEAALARLRADKGLALDKDRSLATRTDQIEGELARARGDLARSATLLRSRAQYFQGFADPRTPPAWSTQLDLAYTLILARDPGAGAALARAAELRPAGMPAGVALDAAQAYLRRLADGADPGAARAALLRASGRAADAGEPALRALLGGVLL